MRVAIYLRKSRGEIDDLAKHKSQLVTIAEKNKWTFDVYEEIGSSDSLEDRPEFMRLLDNIKKYKKILIIALDRLSRNQLHQSQIINILKDNQVEIVTPSRVYNFEEESDIITSDFEMLLARQEYRLIKKRLKQGKINGAKQGNFVNGKPPLGYKYNSVTKEVEVDEEQAKVYRYIVDKILSGEYSSYSLSFELNKQKIPTSYGREWNNQGIYRLLLSEFHMGYVKYQGEWFEGRHKPLKTKEEHDRITLIFNNRGKTPRRKVKNVFELSGIMQCSCCGHTLTVAKKKKDVFIKPCWYRDSIGNKCDNRGIKQDVALEYIMSSVNSHVDEIRDLIKQGDNEINKKKKQELANQKELLLENVSNLDNRKHRILEMIESQIYDLATGKQKLNEVEQQKTYLQKDISIIELHYQNINDTLEDDLITLEQIQEQLLDSQLSSEEVNTLLRNIIKKISYRRQDDELSMEIEYL